MKKNIFLLLFYLLALHAKAQINNENLMNNIIYRDTIHNKIQFSYNSLFCVHNREYFNNIADGYTMMVYWLNPKIAYQPSPKVLLEGGVFIRKEIGTSGIDKIEPTFTIKIRNNQWNYLFGNLEGNLSHQLIEPLMAFEKSMTRPMEQGLQVKYIKKDTFFDTWVDYQQGTLPGYSNQEHFFAGLSYRTKILNWQYAKLSVIAQSSVFHTGGQNLLNNNLGVRTLLNPVLGLQYQRHFANDLTLHISNYYVAYLEAAKTGNAIYTNATLVKNGFQFNLSYWNSTNFNSPMGGDLFQSSSRVFGKENHYESKRELIFIKLIKDWKIIDGMYLSARFEPYFDINNRLFEHVESICIKYSL